jgi:phage tail protein X
MLLTIRELGDVFAIVSAEVFENNPKLARLCPFQLLTQAHFMKLPTISSSPQNFEKLPLNNSKAINK